jgi:hypothetical protein
MSDTDDAIGRETYRTVAAFASGNVAGVVEERVTPQGDERDQLVKIGVIDEERARYEPYPEKDFDIVVRQLREFIEQSGIQ